MSVIIAPGTNALAARKLLYLPPGQYMFSSAYRFGASNASSSAQWILKCGGNGGNAAAMTLAISPENKQSLTANPVIRPGCAPQYLDLTIRSDGNGSDTELIIDSVVLRPSAG
jgi:hypothetical protein